MTPDGPFTSRAYLLLCSIDLPAQAIVSNMKQYNGAFGYAYCEEEGCPRPSSRMHRNWPKRTIDAPLRTHQSVLSNAQEATTTKSAVSYGQVHTCLSLRTFCCVYRHDLLPTCISVEISIISIDELSRTVIII